jgi:UDP-3-O-[3-hydroxymyristoyl] glucosamine N-acyltransferase
VKLKELAELIEGTVIGDGEVPITGVKDMAEAQEGDITFTVKGRIKNEYLSTIKASAVITTKEFKDLKTNIVLVDNVYYAFARTLEIFYPTPKHEPGISVKAFISPDADIAQEGVTVYPNVSIGSQCSIGSGVVLYPGVYIGDGTTIGAGTTIYPHVTIYRNITIGKNVIIHAGCVIGADGFGYVQAQGKAYKIPQVGGVIIEDNVEIGANTTIDRATLVNTIIGAGSKIDNLVQIAHNVRIGKQNLIASQSGISGSSVLGNGVILAGQVGIGDHVTIADRVILGGKSGVGSNIRDSGPYSGIPAIPHKKWLKAQSLFAKLPDLLKKLRDLEAKVNKLM